MILMIWWMLSLVSLHSAIKKKILQKKKEGEIFWVIIIQYVLVLS